MNIVCSIDEAYAQHCGVMLCSLFKNNPGIKFRVFLITDGLTEISRQKLTSVSIAWRQQMEWVQIDARAFHRARVSGHVSAATYFRILIPKILPDDVDKVLFLDSDIIVRGSVTELYSEPIDGHTHAAVENPLSQGDVERLGIPGGSTYFNAGVLLLNIHRWRAEQLSERVLDYVKVDPGRLLWWDQDALNATLHGRWRQCRPTWNAQEAFFRNLSASELGVSEEDLFEVRSNPRIVHFSGSRKPWRYHYQHPFKSEYYKYLALTPWKGYRPFDRPSAPRRARLWVARVAPRFVRDAYRRLAVILRPAAPQAS
jgi:lipopolysaccharide biosynthesis glycosyltransferase